MEKRLVYTPRKVCSQAIEISVEDNIVKSVTFYGGCQGNTQAVSALVKGMNVQEVIARLEGINCNGKGTSCPDQLAQALRQMVSQ